MTYLDGPSMGQTPHTGWYIEPARIEETRWVGQCVRCRAVHFRVTFQSGLADGYGRVTQPDHDSGYATWRMNALKAPGRPRLLRACHMPDRKTKGTEDCGGIVYECEGQAALLSAIVLGGKDAALLMVDAWREEHDRRR